MVSSLRLYAVVAGALAALGDCCDPAMAAAALEQGLPAPDWYGWLLVAPLVEPEPVSAKLLQIRNPYASPDYLESRLVRGQTKGFLAGAPSGGYLLTAKGREASTHVLEAAYQALAKLSPMAYESLERLAGLLGRLVGASLAAPEPPAKWCLVHAHRGLPNARATPLIRIDQSLTDLSAYRDDAHLAAWQPLGVTGAEWESLTLLWRDEAHSAPELHARLERRGHQAPVYAQAIEVLVERGWASGGAAACVLTPLGRNVREQAEAQTETYFYRPWSVLSNAELQSLSNLLDALIAGVG